MPTSRSFDRPRLLADIGTVVAHFALETAPGVFAQARALRCADHADFTALVQAYLDACALPPASRVVHAAVAIAYPVAGDDVRITNHHWRFSIEQARAQLGLDKLLVVNDFTALALAVPRLPPAGWRQIGGGIAQPRGVVGVLGAGSGLGMSGVVPVADGHVSLGSEGGHASFAPRDEREIAILRHAWRTHDHVSFERLASGPGLERIYDALRDAAGLPATAAPPSAPAISQRALRGDDPIAVEACEALCGMLGTIAGNLALTLGARGGIYLGGSIVPRLGALFDRSPFRRRFEDRGRFSAYLAAIPTRVIVDDDATLRGASAVLDAHLKSLPSIEGSAILARIRHARGELSPAELRVGDLVLAQPRTVLNQPIADIAKAAEVSQPTVIRFCRSLGCEGLSDFKLKLASGLTGTVPIQHVQVTDDDSGVEIGAKVLGNTASAVLQMRNQLNRDMIERATQLIAAARRVEFCAVGQFAAVAHDAQYKFLRFGIPAGAHADPRLQALAVGVLQPGDAVVVISAVGRLPELLEVVDRARERGVAVVAITATQSPLARRADAVLGVDHVEDTETHVPMISRVLHLLMVDLLTVGLAMRRGSASPLALLADEAAEPAVDAADDGAAPAAPGLAHLERPRG